MGGINAHIKETQEASGLPPATSLGLREKELALNHVGGPTQRMKLPLPQSPGLLRLQSCVQSMLFMVFCYSSLNGLRCASCYSS